MDNFNTDGNIHWTEFNLVDVFNVFNTKSILKEKIVPDSGTIPYVTAGELNNAVMTYIDCPKEWIDKGNCILIGGKTMVVTYQKDDFCSNDSHNLALYLKDETVKTNKYLYLFLVAVVKKALGGKYVWGDSISYKKIQKDRIQLPVKDNNEIAWDFMREHIIDLEQECIVKLETFLNGTGLNDYGLIETDKQVLAKKVQWKEFKLNDIAHLEYGNKFDKNKMKYLNPTVNFVSRTASNNGISDFVDEIMDVKPYSGGLITLAFGGSIGSCFLQEKPFYTGQNVGVIDLGKVSSRAKLFVTNVISKKCKASYVAFGDEINKHFKVDLFIELPVTDEGQPNWDYMEQYIRATEKVVIANAVKWKDRKKVEGLL